MPSNGVSSVSWHGHVGIDAPRDRYLSHSIGPTCLFGHTHVECPICFVTPHNHAPHRQNTQPDRMFISFDSHPYGVDTDPPPCTDGYTRLPHMHPLWTWVCHHLGYPPRVVAAWMPHSGSRCGVSPASGITHEVMCRVSAPSCMDAHNTRDRSWFVHPGTSSCLVWSMMSDTHVIHRCPTHHSSR